MTTSLSLRHIFYLLLLGGLIGSLVLPPRLTPEHGAECLGTEIEPNGRVGDVARLPVLCADVPLSGVLPEGDSDDLYRLELERQGLISLQLTGMSAEVDYDLYLYSATRELMAASRQVGSSTEQVEVRLTPGTYYVRIYPFQGRSTQPYRLSWHESSQRSGGRRTFPPLFRAGTDTQDGTQALLY